MPGNVAIIGAHRNNMDVTKMAVGKPPQRDLKSVDPLCSHQMLLDGLERGHDQPTNETDVLRVPYLVG